MSRLPLRPLLCHTPHVATPTITIRLPVDARTALEAQASTAGVPLRTWIVTTLTDAAGTTYASVDPTTTPQNTGMTVPSPAPKPIEPAAPIRANVTPLRAEAVAERDQRHLSPIAAPDREEIRKGYTVAEATCEHPRAERQQFSYMTRCGLCGRRLL